MKKIKLRGEYKGDIRRYVLPDGRPIQQAVREALDSGYNHYATRMLSTDLKGLEKRIESRLNMKHLGLAPWALRSAKEHNLEGARNALLYVYRLLQDASRSEHGKWMRKEGAMRGSLVAVLSSGTSRRFSESRAAGDWVDRQIKGKPGMQGAFFHAYERKSPYNAAPFHVLEANEYGVVHITSMNAWRGPVLGEVPTPERDPKRYTPTRGTFVKSYRVTHIPLDRGGYAPSLGHRYFGTGPKLWMVERTDDEHFVIVRAASAKAARTAAATNPNHWGGWRTTFR